MTNSNHSRILPLVSLRGIFCIIISVFHSQIRIVFEQLATCGVVFFFIMSGFFMAMHHPAGSINRNNYKRYILSKAMRIYPIHWLALAMLLGFHFVFSTQDVHIVWNAIVPNVLLVQSYFPNKDIFFSFNSVSWFLCSMLFCYLCYPIIINTLKTICLKWRIIAILILIIIYGVALYPIDNEEVITYTHVCPLLRLYEFTIGIVLCDIYASLRGKMRDLTTAQATIIEAAPFILLVLLVTADLLHHEIFRNNYDDSYLWEIPTSLLVLSFTLTAGEKGLIGRTLCWKPLVWLGELSLELFLFQGIAGLMYNYLVSPVFGHFGMIIYPYYPLGLLPILVILAWLTHRFFTQPLSRWTQAHG